MSWSFDYTPQPNELRKGTSLATRAAFSGRWNAAFWLYGLFRGAGIALLAAFLSLWLLSLAGFRIEEAPHFYYVSWIVFMLGLWSLGRLIFRQLAEVQHASPMMQDQMMTLSAEGITLTNGRSQMHTNWADVISIEEKKDITVATLGSTGLILPDRLLAQVGDAAVIREQIKAWHAQAKAAA